MVCKVIIRMIDCLKMDFCFHAKNDFSLQDNRRYWKSSGWFSCMRVKRKTRERRKYVFCFLFPSFKGLVASSETQGQIVGSRESPNYLPLGLRGCFSAFLNPLVFALFLLKLKWPKNKSVSAILAT